jgi:hypothetical protein
MWEEPEIPCWLCKNGKGGVLLGAGLGSRVVSVGSLVGR